MTDKASPREFMPSVELAPRVRAGLTYGILYGMEKTTVYVPPEVKRALGRLASARGTSEAELIREALRKIVAEAPAPRPRLPLIESGKRMLAERVDEALEGFGSP
ncbi:MAG: CopG family transcriptional regulator [Burkholderiaceae bacterium]